MRVAINNLKLIIILLKNKQLEKLNIIKKLLLRN